jgi:hypothetical protein
MARHLVNLSFDPVHELYQQSQVGNELVIEKLDRQATLKISNHWNPKKQARNLADDNTFMKMGMDDVRPEFVTYLNDFPQQEKIDIKLVKRRTCR